MVIQPQGWVMKCFPDLVWRMPGADNTIYLTFDDGPDPEGTPRILDLLAEYKAKATFFCLGRRVEKYPDLFERIKKEGHAVGNHTYSHLSGWTTGNRKYFEDIERADKLIGSKLFRPPYGRIRPSQIRVLKERYKIIMWDVMSGDYDPRQTPEQISRRLEKHIRPGSVVVGHEGQINYFNRKIFFFKSVYSLAKL
ncbi:MAG: polysaccharide deacetylase family protein [Chlorobi bacterium]|nr:polysaccharide deacetylase family protein [Chlorobiota bacterium]